MLLSVNDKRLNEDFQKVAMERLVGGTGGKDSKAALAVMLLANGGQLGDRDKTGTSGNRSPGPNRKC